MICAGGLRPAKHTRVLASAKWLAGSPAARACLSRQLRWLGRSPRRTVPDTVPDMYLYYLFYYIDKGYHGAVVSI